jgi:hypothetical protein
VHHKFTTGVVDEVAAVYWCISILVHHKFTTEVLDEVAAVYWCITIVAVGVEATNTGRAVAVPLQCKQY